MHPALRRILSQQLMRKGCVVRASTIKLKQYVAVGYLTTSSESAPGSHARQLVSGMLKERSARTSWPHALRSIWKLGVHGHKKPLA